jgi:hypothetical protein
MNKPHPSNDPNLPSFLHPIALEVAADLALVQDCWDNLKGKMQCYLPKELKERPNAYNARLNRVKFDNRFKPAISSYAGLLSDFLLADNAPRSIAEAENNIDLHGSSLVTFFDEVDQSAMRDGGCAILTEYQTEDVQLRTVLDQQRSGRRPYLVKIDRRNILNWRISYNNGQPVIDQVVIKEVQLIPDGMFGIAHKVVYRLLSPGIWQLWEIREVASKWMPVLLGEGSTSLNKVPIVWYSYSSNNLFEGDLPFVALADLNIEHLQKRSDLNEVLHKCNLPVPVRKGAAKDPQTGRYPDLSIGANSLVDVPKDGEFGFAEPTGAAIAASQADIEKLEKSMDRLALAFLSGGDVERTATEATLDAAQIQSTIQSLARRKESLVQSIFADWTAYTGEPPDGAIAINERILKPSPTPEEVRVILDSIDVQIDRETGLRMLIDRQWIPTEIKLEEILQRMGDSDREQEDVQTQGVSGQTANGGAGEDD